MRTTCVQYRAVPRTIKLRLTRILPGNTFQRMPGCHASIRHHLPLPSACPGPQARALARFRRGKGVVALTLGFLFTVGLPIGLMALVFNDRSGRDDEANRA